MDIVIDRAIEFTKRRLRGAANADEFIEDLESEIAKFRNTNDRLCYLTTVVEQVKVAEEEHALECPHPPKVCRESRQYRDLSYFFKRMLEDYDIGIDQEQVFSPDEKAESNRKIDELLQEVEKLRKGQEIIYDDVMREIQELKNLYFLGKKNWGQIIAGKALEMACGGVVSETVSKKLISVAGSTFDGLQITQ